MTIVRDMEWLLARVAIQDDGCWHWTRYVGPNGYGYATVDGVPTPAPRVAYRIKNGDWPEVCRHKCDNRLCVNPNHLENGTTADNVRDFMERSDAHRGEDHEGAKLSDLQVYDIKAGIEAGERNVDLAKEYGVDPSLISHIRRGAKRRYR